MMWRVGCPRLRFGLVWVADTPVLDDVESWLSSLALRVGVEGNGVLKALGLDSVGDVPYSRGGEAAGEELVQVVDGGSDTETQGFWYGDAVADGLGEGGGHGIAAADRVDDFGLRDAGRLKSPGFRSAGEPDGVGTVGDDDPLGSTFVERAHGVDKCLVGCKFMANCLGQFFAIRFDDGRFQIEDTEESFATDVEDGWTCWRAASRRR